MPFDSSVDKWSWYTYTENYYRKIKHVIDDIDKNPKKKKKQPGWVKADKRIARNVNSICLKEKEIKLKIELIYIYKPRSQNSGYLLYAVGRITTPQWYSHTNARAFEYVR